MAKEKIPKEIKGRIGPLLQCLPISWSLSFRGRPETQEVAELLDSVLRPTRLLGLLRQAEKRGHLAPGTADALDAARGKFNPYLFLAAQIETELRLTLLTPRLRHMHGGRPSAFRSALVADAVADEIRKASKAPWPIVSGLFAPFLKVLRPQIKGDPTHLRQLVVNRKRIADRKVKAGKTNESWKDAKALLYQEAGLA